MPYLAMAASVALLVLANWAVRQKSVSALGGLFVGAGLGVVGGCVLMSQPVVYQGFFLCLALVLLLVPRHGRRLYLAASILATLAAWGIVLNDSLDRQQRYADLRDQNPFESLEGRLPARPAADAPRLSDPSRLEDLESTVEREADGYSSRSRALRELHAERVHLFANSPGFGHIRMAPLSPEYVLRPNQDAPAPQPGEGSRKHPSAGGEPWSPEKDRPSLGKLHDAGVLDFVNPRGFGLVQDRTRVAGFRPHGMSKVPDPADRWAVRTIDLVGLLLAEAPRAYVSANLPRMDEVRTAPTRPLDPFEEAGLAKLRRGEELHVQGGDAEVRMVGAIRAAKQCVTCHGGARGDLLGAFSYRLRPKD